MKHIDITFPNGDRFFVPAKEVALNRTNYYESKGDFGYKSNEWHEEFEHSMQDDVLIDWLQNDMNWEDIQHCATKYEDTEPNYYKLFSEAKFKIG
jgi:hypothetical protein